MARPKLENGKTATFKMRCSEEERIALSNCAEELGTDVAKLVRLIPDPQVKELLAKKLQERGLGKHQRRSRSSAKCLNP